MNMLTIVAVPMHREGRKFVAIFAAIAVALSFVWEPLFWLGCGVTVWCYYFFRDPVRVVPQQEGLVQSTADGVVFFIQYVIPPAGRGLGDAQLQRGSVSDNVLTCPVIKARCRGMMTAVS